MLRGALLHCDDDAGKDAGLEGLEGLGPLGGLGNTPGSPRAYAPPGTRVLMVQKVGDPPVPVKEISKFVFQWTKS